MKIACVDKTANERTKLVNYFERAYENSRSALGFLRLAEFTPYSKNEIILCNSFDAIVLGPALSEDELLHDIKEFKELHPEIPILILVKQENYNLKILKRFSNLANEIFSQEESETRILHFLCKLGDKKYQDSLGKIITLNGAKGGVGTTSIATALAHAAIAVGKSSIIVDFSLNSSLLHYLAAPRWQSAEYANNLLEEKVLNQDFIEKLITTAPNGIDLLLPPAGNKEIRELWLRNQNCFEFSLQIIETLRNLYQLVIIDIANAEGILPFAINSRSFIKILISSNEPASVYLLNHKINELSEAPGNSDLLILINELIERGLSKNDIFDFLSTNTKCEREFSKIKSIPFDKMGKHWVGTGNSFYTQGSNFLKNTMEDLVLDICQDQEYPRNSAINKKSWFKKLLSHFSQETDLFYPKEQKNNILPQISWKQKNKTSDLSGEEFKKQSVNSRGSLSLESLLFLTGTIALAATVLPVFINNIQGYVSGFVEFPPQVEKIETINN